MEAGLAEVGLSGEAFDIVEGLYLRDILDQPRAMEATLRNVKVPDRLCLLRDGLAQGTIRRIVLTGMGASFHALWPLFLQLTQHGHSTVRLEISELLYYLPELFTPETLIVGVSQSGMSAEVVRLLDVNRSRAAIVGVTNSADSALAQQSDAVLLTEAGPEFSVSCKTYITALAELRLLGALLCGENVEQVKLNLRQGVAALEQYLHDWRERVADMAAALDGIRQIFLVGRGDSLGAVGAGALILKESVRFPSEGMSSAALRHGPFEMLSPSTFTAVFAGAEKTRALQNKLLEDIRQVGGKAGWIDGNSDSCWTMPKVADELRPITEILPIQMMTLALAARAGVEAGRFARVSKVTTVE